jgi:hypothetical protein
VLSAYINNGGLSERSISQDSSAPAGVSEASIGVSNITLAVLVVTSKLRPRFKFYILRLEKSVHLQSKNNKVLRFVTPVCLYIATGEQPNWFLINTRENFPHFSPPL